MQDTGSNTKKLFRFCSFLTTVANTVSDFVLHWALYPLAFSLFAGAGIWTFVYDDMLKELASNKVAKEQRIVALAFVATALLFVLALYAVQIVRHRKREGAFPDYSAFFPLHRRLSIGFALPFMGILATPRIQDSDPIFATAAILAACAACYPAMTELISVVKAFAGRESGNVRTRIAPVLRFAPELIVFAMFAAYSIHFSVLTVNKLHALHTHTSDMAIYVNVIYHTLHGDFLGTSIMRSATHASAHFDPILLLMSPLFALYQRPEFLLIFQSIWFALGIFAAYLIGNRVLQDRWAGVIIAAVYALHPSLHAVNIFEFHSLALSATPVLWALYLLEARYYKRFFALLPIALFVREDVSLLMCFIALWVILSKRKDAWVGAITIFISVSYLFIIKKCFMTSASLIMSGKGSYNYSGYFKYMIPNREGMGEMILSVLSNPIYTLRNMISMEKLEFLLRLLSPTLFLPLVAKTGRVMLLYGAIFLLMASRKPVFNAAFHYQMVAFPILIFLLPFGIKRIVEDGVFGVRRPSMTAVLGVLTVAAVLSSLTFGHITQNSSKARYSYAMTKRQAKIYEEVERMLAKIEPDASVTASYNLSPFVAVRTKVYTMNHYRPRTPVDYLFLDRSGTRKNQLSKFDEQINDGIYKRVDGYRNIVLYKSTGKKNEHKSEKRPPSKKTRRDAHRRSSIPHSVPPRNGPSMPSVVPPRPSSSRNDRAAPASSVPLGLPAAATASSGTD